MKKQFVMGTVSALVVLAVTPSVTQAADSTGWYGDINLGRGNLKQKGGGIDDALSNQGLTTSSSIKKHDVGYSLNLGYQFNPYFAVEGNYADLGKYKFDSSVSAPSADTVSGDYKVRGMGFSAVGILPLDEGWALFGKAGVMRSKVTLDASSTGIVATSGGSHTGTGATYGTGVSYDFTKEIVGKAEWNRYQNVGDGATTGKSAIDLYTVGVGFKF
jgi:OOP family OmpA-OmpF porin